MAQTILRQRCDNNLDLGFIYVAQMVGHPIYKIGRSLNVPRRMSEIGVQLPFPYHLCFAHKVPYVHFTESDLHRDLSYYRKNGEWFELTECALRMVRLRLLYAQTEWLAHRVVERFNYDDLYPCVLKQYGRVFLGLGKRNARRLSDLVDAERYLADQRIVQDVLSAEIIA
jgi:hypothetical protein